ncbi:MAG: response regulator, partial [Pseudomonadota bacterium]
VRIVTQKLLNELGFDNVTLAGNGREAVKELERDHYDLLITDWNMPGMSGIELLRWVRCGACQPDLPIMMVTSEEDNRKVAQALSYGANGYLLKPLNAASLAAGIHDALTL